MTTPGEPLADLIEAASKCLRCGENHPERTVKRLGRVTRTRLAEDGHRQQPLEPATVTALVRLAMKLIPPDAARTSPLFPNVTLVDDLLEAAWGIIANAGWDDSAKSPGWQEAAVRWRDRYHAALSATLSRQNPDPPDDTQEAPRASEAQDEPRTRPVPAKAPARKNAPVRKPPVRKPPAK